MLNKKITIEFNIESHDDEQEIKDVLNAGDLKLALWDIAQEVFRPHRKHGYSDVELQKLFNEESRNTSSEVVEKLESRFYNILRRYDINL